MNRPRFLDLYRHSFPYMVNLCCLFRRHKSHKVNYDVINTLSQVSQISLVLTKDYQCEVCSDISPKCK